MTLAERTRAACRQHPFLVAALRADVVNFSAAARFLPVEGDQKAVATALRRYAADLPAYEPSDRRAQVTMQSGLSALAPDDAGNPLFVVGDTAFEHADGDLTGLLASGAVDAAALSTVLARCRVEDVRVRAAGVAGEALLVVVDGRDGPDALRVVEDALETVDDR